MNTTSNADNRPAQRPRRVLVIDDEEVVVHAATRILSSEGFEVVGAGDAEAALALLETERPEVAVVDLKLPGLSGTEFIEASRQSLPDLIVIITTGVSSADQAIKALQSGAFDFLPKPFTFEELLSPVHRADRFIKLREGQGRGQRAMRRPDECFLLGPQSWAKIEDAGLVRIGVTEIFTTTAESAVAVDLPDRDHWIGQGGTMARISSEDGLSHQVLSPLGGVVVEPNRRLLEKPGLLIDDPFESGWLAVIRAPDLRHQLDSLTHYSESG